MTTLTPSPRSSRAASTVVGLALLIGGLVAPIGTAAAATPPLHETAAAAAAPCTKTSSGTCIRGGQFCPRASFGRSGWDAKGRRYVCKGDRSHPHWMIP